MRQAEGSGGRIVRGLVAVIAMVVAIGCRKVAHPETEPKQEQPELESKVPEPEPQRHDDASSVGKARQAMSLVDGQRGVEALALAVEAAGPYGPDYMGAPMEVLQALFDVQTVSVVGSTRVIETGEVIHQVLFTPDGEHIIGLPNEPSALIWNREGELLDRLAGHAPSNDSDAPTTNVCAIRLSPAGQPVEVLSDDGRGRVWRASGELLFSPESGRIEVDGIWSSWAGSVLSVDPSPGSRNRSVAISPTGKLIVIHDKNRESFQIWDSSNRMANKVADSGGSRFTADFARNGSLVAFASGDGLLVVYDDTGRQVSQLEVEKMTDVVFLGRDGSAVRTGGPAFMSDPSVLHAHEEADVRDVAFAPDKSYFVSVGDDRTLRFWKLHTPLAVTQRSERIWGEIASQSNDGSLVMTRDPFNLWRADGQLLREFGWQQRCFEFSPDSSTLVTCDAQGKVELWDRAGQLVNSAARDLSSDGEIVFTPDSARFYVTGRAKQHSIWTTKGECVVSLPMEGVSVSWAAFIHGGTRLLTHSAAEEMVVVWDERGQPLAEVPSKMTPVLSQNHERMLAFPRGGAPRLWSTSGELVSTLPGAPTFQFDGVWPEPHAALSADGQLVALSTVQRMFIWSMNGMNGELKATIDAPPNYYKVAFAPDNSRLAVASSDGLLFTIEGERVATLNGHKSAVRNVTFSGDGRWLAVESSDEVDLWEPESGRLLARLPGAPGQIRFSEDGSRIIQNERGDYVWLTPAALVRRACEILSEFPEQYPRVAEICVKSPESAPRSR